MKSKIKRLKVLYWLYRKIDPCVRLLLFRISPILGNKYIYRTIYGRRLNLKNPELLSEKLIWLKLYGEDPLWITCTDKYEVRAFVEKRGCGDTLNELIGLYDQVMDISWIDLPNQFVLKGTHGCGCNIICPDKQALDESETREKLASWMLTDYAKFMGENHYSKIKPRIVAEKFLGDDTGDLPLDYKILCFNGSAKVMMFCNERSTKVKFTFLDLDWNILDVNSDRYPPEKFVEKPTCLGEMVDYAERLANGFPFVRVDFYIVENRIIFGEMTFTPAGGIVAYFNDVGDRLLGNMLALDIKS